MFLQENEYQLLAPANSWSHNSPVKRRPNSNNMYNRYKGNRVNSITEIPSSEARNTIGIHELSSTEAKETFGEDGTCFFIVANAPQRTRVVASYIEETERQSIVTTTLPINTTQTISYSDPYQRNGYQSYHDTLKRNIHIVTKDPSVSSGVGSGESSELDSPNPPPDTYPQKDSCNIDEECLSNDNVRHNRSKRSTSSNDCTCNTTPSPLNTKRSAKSFKKTMRSSLLSSSTDSSRRDSGFSSMSSSSALQLSPLRSIDEFKVSQPCSHSPRQMNSSTNLDTNHEKEVMLMRIKKSMYDPQKENLVQNIKRLLYDSGHETFVEQVSSLNWTPLLSSDKFPGKSLLKKPRTSLLEEIQSRHQLKSLQQAKQEERLLSPLKRSEIVKIIEQVRQCLQFTPLQRNFQIHRKIKLKQFPPYSSHQPRHQIQTENESNLQTQRLKQAAGKGDIKQILNLLNSKPCVPSSMDSESCVPSSDWQPFHAAFKKEHYRTAILLIEAGTDVKEYTERRVKEFHAIMDIVNRNKKIIH